MNILKRLVTWSLLLVAGLSLTLFGLLRGSLPQLDGELVIDGPRAEVTIERDAAGIPVITADNRIDLAFATGFVHGQDRFFQMDLSRRRSAGELSALFGPIALPLDRRNRLHRFRSRARDVVAGLPSFDRMLAEAYTAGVNAGLDTLSVRPFEYLLLRATPAPWAAEDSMLVAYNMFIELNDENADRDSRRGLAHQVLPQPLFDFLYPDGTEWDAPMTGDARPQIPPPGAAQSSDLRTAAAQDHERPDTDAEEYLPGSNNWAVAGNLTDTGRAIVANDMHLGITAPGVFYRARLIVTGGVTARPQWRHAAGRAAVGRRQQRPHRLGQHQQLR